MLLFNLDRQCCDMSDSGVDSFLSCSAIPGILNLFIHSLATQLSQVCIIYSFILFFSSFDPFHSCSTFPGILYLFIHSFFSSFDPFLSCSAFPGILYLFNHSFNHPLSAQLSQVNFFYSIHSFILTFTLQSFL